MYKWTIFCVSVYSCDQGGVARLQQLNPASRTGLDRSNPKYHECNETVATSWCCAVGISKLTPTSIQKCIAVYIKYHQHLVLYVGKPTYQKCDQELCK